MQSKGIQILEGSLWKNIPKFAIPVALTGILGQLFNAADIAVVGRFTGDMGTVNMAAVGANSPVVGLIISVFVGVSLGANVVIANAVGRQADEDVQKATHTSILFALLSGIAVAILGELTAAPLLNLMNIPSEVMSRAVLYLQIYYAGLPVILLFYFESAIFRSVGDTRTPLIALTISGVLNVILNLFFVIGLDMEVDGVALATVISNLLSSVYLFILLLRTDLPVKVHMSEMRIDGRILRRILRIGLPAGLQSGVFSIANMYVQSAVNSLGTTIVAASSAALNIEIFCYDMLNSFSQACSTFVGQNYGAGNLDRCRKTLKVCLIEDLIASACSVAIALFFGRALLGIFSSDPDVIEYGYLRLCIIFAAYTFSMLYEVLSGYLRGFGISMIPALVTMISVCGIRFFWIYAVFPHFNTFGSIMIVYPISLGITAALIFMLLIHYRPSRKMLGTEL
jgi:putative MATE family efflux protein